MNLLPLQLQPNKHVKGTYGEHGQDEEQQGGHLDGQVIHPARLNQRADLRVGDLHAHHAGWASVVTGEGLDPMQARVGQCAQHRHPPHQQNDPLSMGAGHDVLGPQGVHHGDVALDAERRHVEDGRQANGLEEEGFEVAAAAAQEEGVVLPQLVQLQRHAEQQDQQVRHRQAEQVIIGRRPHHFVARDDGARQHVAHDAQDEDDEVGAADRNEDGRPPVAQVFVEVLLHSETGVIHFHLAPVNCRGQVLAVFP